MAKKRKDTSDEEELDFKFPKFDEEKFLKRERRNIKTMFISFLFGLLISIISFGFWSLLSESDLRWGLVIIFAIFNASWLRYIFIKLNMDLTDFGRKGWFGSYAIYLFTWLLILIMLCNPPFYDNENPKIDSVVLPDMQEFGGTVKIIAKITDNVGVEKDDISFSLNYQDGSNALTGNFEYTNNVFIYTYTNPLNLLGEFSYNLSATDVNGHTATTEGTFTYNNNTIRLPEPIGADKEPGPLVAYTTTIKFDVDANVGRVYYTVDDGKPINATKNGDYYETNPEYKGWLRNKNVTVRVYAEVIHYFPETYDSQQPLPYVQQHNNTIVDSQTYYFRVSGTPEIGMKESPAADLPTPTFIQVPGFELIVFIVSLAITALIFKYRRKHRRN